MLLIGFEIYLRCDRRSLNLRWTFCLDKRVNHLDRSTLMNVQRVLQITNVREADSSRELLNF